MAMRTRAKSAEAIDSSSSLAGQLKLMACTRMVGCRIAQVLALEVPIRTGSSYFVPTHVGESSFKAFEVEAGFSAIES